MFVRQQENNLFCGSTQKVALLIYVRNSMVHTEWTSSQPGQVKSTDRRYFTHSLTAALDQLRVVASSTSNDPGPRSRQHQQIGQPLLPLAAGCSQFLRGRPGGRFQSAAGGVPVWASIDSWSACEAGVFSGIGDRCVQIMNDVCQQ